MQLCQGLTAINGTFAKQKTAITMQATRSGVFWPRSADMKRAALNQKVAMRHQ
jgi:hypothetical protein